MGVTVVREGGAAFLLGMEGRASLGAAAGLAPLQEPAEGQRRKTDRPPA